MPLTTIKDGVRRANITFIEFNGADHRNKIFEQLAKECGFGYGYRNGLWTHLKDKKLSMEFESKYHKVWIEYDCVGYDKTINTPSVSLFIDEVLSFIREFYMNEKKD